MSAGLAVAYRRFSREYVDDEPQARASRQGAWAYPFQSPETFRHASSYHQASQRIE